MISDFSKKLDIIFERDMSDKEMSNSLFLYGDISKKVQQKYKKLIELNGDDILEEENQPHMTFLYLPHPVTGLDGKELYDIIKPILKGNSFTIKTKNFDVFKGVGFNNELNAADCLVVKLEVPKEMKEAREEVKKAISDNGGKFTETYKEFKPHMTIAYYKKGKIPEKLPKFEPEEISLPSIKFQYGGEDGEKRNF